MSNIHAQLENFGLTKTEATVYVYLLRHGVSSPSILAKGTGIARTNCYHVLRGLLERGLIVEQKKGKRLVYAATDPQALIASIERKKQEMESLLPDLRALHTATEHKPSIEFFDGFSQVKEIYMRSALTQEGRVRAIGSTKTLSSIDESFLTQYFQKIKERGIVFEDLLTSGSRQQAGIHKELLKGLYDVHFLPDRVGDQPTDILIWDHSVALITLKEPIFGTVITSPLLAKSFQALFSVMYERGE